MLIDIIKIEGEKVTVKKDNIEKTYIMEDFVIPHVKLGVGNISFNDETQKVSFIKMEPTEEQDRAQGQKPESKESYIVNIKGKDFMTYEGLLKLAHKKDENFSITIVESWQSEDLKRAWCKVRLTALGRTFDGIGSSTPENTGQMTQDHPIEMANARAKGRALRDYLNIGQAMAEELKK